MEGSISLDHSYKKKDYRAQKIGQAVVPISSLATYLLIHYLSLPLQFPYVSYGQPRPFILPRPRLPVGPQHDTPQAVVVDETLDLRLQAPVPKLNLKQLEKNDYDDPLPNNYI